MIIRPKKGLQGRWPQALAFFILPLGIYLFIRFFVIEPFLIPSESMEPNLLVNDHILVKKWNHGVRVPVVGSWILKFSEPQRGDIIVFKYPENPKVFYVKRLIGLPGDHIEITDMIVKINGESVNLEPVAGDSYYLESHPQFGKDHIVKYDVDAETSSYAESKVFDVPKGAYFVLGDNRYNSVDSRFWGFVPEKDFIGSVFKVWMSCDKMLETAPFLCDLSTIRWDRILKSF